MALTKVGILGSGQVAKVLAEGFLKHGYDVLIGSREPEKLKSFSEKNQSRIKTGTFEDAADFGNIVVLAVKGSAAESVVRSVARNLSGKTVIDTSNPIAESPPEHGVLKLFTDLNSSLMERLQSIAARAHFVKAFSSVGNARMVNPQFSEGKPTMFICGNDDEAKKDVAEILFKFGWDTSDMGKAGAARAIEPLCMLWCIPGFLRNEWTHAFKILHA
jgi:8-hydroxy-5-deazaflavin:NADPH oxidoreductase